MANIIRYIFPWAYWSWLIAWVTSRRFDLTFEDIFNKNICSARVVEVEPSSIEQSNELALVINMANIFFHHKT